VKGQFLEVVQSIEKHCMSLLHTPQQKKISNDINTNAALTFLREKSATALRSVVKIV